MEFDDQEADVNDSHTRLGFVRPYKQWADQRVSNDHIYPRLHGTGGIGPGTWRRGGLAARQEHAATDKRDKAHVIVHALLRAIQTPQRWDDLVDTVARLL